MKHGRRHAHHRAAQRRAARRGDRRGRPRAGARRRGKREDPGARPPRRVARRDRAGASFRDPRGDLHQQGGARDAGAHRGDSRAAHRGDVGRHVPRHRPSLPPRPPGGGGVRGVVPDRRQRRPVPSRAPPHARDEPGRRELAAAAGPGVHQRPEGERGPRPPSPRARRSLGTADVRGVPNLRGGVRGERARRLRRAAPPGVGGAARAARLARPVPGAVRAPARGRVPGHERPSVRVDLAPRGRPGAALHGGRRRPVHLRLARRAHREHPEVRPRLPRRHDLQARGELPLHAQDPRRRQRGHQEQRGSPRQEPPHVEVGRRADLRLLGLQRPRRGALRGRTHRAGPGRRLAARRPRGPVPDERPVTGNRGCASHRGGGLPDPRGAPVLRAGRDQGCGGVPSARGVS